MRNNENPQKYCHKADALFKKSQKHLSRSRHTRKTECQKLISFMCHINPHFYTLFTYQICVKCAQTQILCVKNIIFHTILHTILLFNPQKTPQTIKNPIYTKTFSPTVFPIFFYKFFPVFLLLFFHF